MGLTYFRFKPIFFALKSIINVKFSLDKRLIGFFLESQVKKDVTSHTFTKRLSFFVDYEVIPI